MWVSLLNGTTRKQVPAESMWTNSVGLWGKGLRCGCAAR